MRLLENSSTRNIFESLKESYGCESYEQAVEQAAEELFDAMTDDIFLNGTSCVQDGDTIKVALDVSAYGYNSEDEDNTEMRRDVTFDIPLDYNSNGENMSVDEFYEAVSEQIKTWIEDHRYASDFYEGVKENKGKRLKESVTVDTGSTIVTSDETGVTIEDNGNTITTSNGVTVNVNNAGDELPAEMDIASPTEELPIDEPVEELPAEEEIQVEEPVEEPEDDLDESTVNEEVLEKKDDETEEEVNNSKIEEAVSFTHTYTKEQIREALEKAFGPTSGYSAESADDPEYQDTLNEILKNVNKIESTEPLTMISAVGADDFPGFDGGIVRTYLDDGRVFQWVEGDENELPLVTAAELTLSRELKNYQYAQKAIKECDKQDKKNKKIEEIADGYDQNQNVEIYQNPEFDYQILDITELDNVDNGDVRAIDMANILNDLDESLTEAYGNPDYVRINSFLTRKGTHKKTNESYSSAILELRLPKLNESVKEYKNVFFLEVYGDKPIKECIVRDSSNHIIKQYSGKSKDPVKHFEGVILDIDRARQLNEDIEFMVNEPYSDGGINFADGKAIEKDEKRQENHLKQHEKMAKGKKFKVEKEPDQENTAGKTEEDATDTAKVEKLPKAKKTKVDAKKLKVKEIKEDISIRGIEDDGSDYSFDKKITKPYYTLVIEHNSGDIADVIEFDTLDKAKSWVNDNKNTEVYDYEICDGKTNDCIEYINESTKLKEEAAISNVEITCSECGEVFHVTVKAKNMDHLADEFNDGDVYCPNCGEHVSESDITNEDVSVLDDDTEVDYGVFTESTKLKEADEELLDEPIVTDGSEPEDELEESGSDVAIFHRKPASVDAMRAAEQNGITVNKSNYKIVGTKELSNEEFNKFANHLSSDEYDWLEEYNDTSNSGEFKCVEVINTDDNSYSILVDPQGYKYARYAAIKDNVDEEELLEPEEELIDETNEEETANE